MKVMPGFAAAIGLNRSSVGPHWALTQNFGVAKINMNGLWVVSASATEVWLKVESGFESVEIFEMSPPTSASVGVREAGAGWPTRIVAVESRTSKVTRTVSAADPGASVLNSAPHVP